jgi:hypothetical protein
MIRNGRALQRTVRPGVSDEHNTEILEGLNERDVVVTTGMTNLRDSSLVKIVSEQP